MTKNEILEAINATIAPNGVKGITAESLANLLTEIVNATPEGGGGSGGSGEGVLRVMLDAGVFDDGDSSELIVTPEMFEQVPGLAEISEEFFRHNAGVYAQLIEKASKNEGTMVLLDSSLVGSVYMSAMLEAYVGESDVVKASASALATVEAKVVKESEVTAMLGLSTGVVLYPLQDVLSSMGRFNGIQLYEDGSLRLFSTNTEPTE